MSKNNQLLVKSYLGKFYVFDVMAESWVGMNSYNRIHVKDALGIFDTREQARKYAKEIDADDPWGGSEYGVVDEVLYKDDAEVTLKD